MPTLTTSTEAPIKRLPLSHQRQEGIVNSARGDVIESIVFVWSFRQKMDAGGDVEPSRHGIIMSYAPYVSRDEDYKHCRNRLCGNLVINIWLFAKVAVEAADITWPTKISYVPAFSAPIVTTRRRCRPTSLHRFITKYARCFIKVTERAIYAQPSRKSKLISFLKYNASNIIARLLTACRVAVSSLRGHWNEIGFFHDIDCHQDAMA